MVVIPSTFAQPRCYTFLFCAFVIFCYHYLINSYESTLFGVIRGFSQTVYVPGSTIQKGQEPACPSTSPLEDFLVVMKTGATEALDKLPIHFSTTLRCVPHYLLLSDLEEDIDGHHLADALSEVDEVAKRTSPEFEFYNEMRLEGRDRFSRLPLSKWGISQSASAGQDNLAWKLDKWKFLPMAHMAYQHRPQAKWYVFLEADTYFVWQNVVSFLSHFDHSKPYYLGYQMQIGSTVFAYGGSGFMISNTGMQNFIDHYQANKAELEEYTEKNWAGDEVLGHSLSQINIPLHWSYPNIQTSTLKDMDFSDRQYRKRLWCYAALGWHHVTPDDVKELYAFDQYWHVLNGTLRHGDVFQHFILPQIVSAPERTEWDNFSEELANSQGDQQANGSLESCRSFCEQHDNCVQYSYKESICRTSEIVKMGRSTRSTDFDLGSESHSGWILERVEKYSRDMGECEEGPWILP